MSSLAIARWEPAPVAQRAPAFPATGSALSGRPTYATGYSGASILPRALAFELLAQFRANVPVVKRATEILSSFVGVPDLVVDGQDAASLWLHDWSNDIEYGDGVGRGLGCWQNDLITQSLVYGFAVGEVEVGASRAGVTRLWTYLSPSVGFRSDSTGKLQAVQNMGIGGEKPLNPETVCRVTHGPLGCNPNGESMLLALPLYCQTLLDVLHAHRSTWRRSGIPTYHVNWEPADDLEDPLGTIGTAVKNTMQAEFNEAMRSQVVDGLAKDFYSTGKIKVSAVGSEIEFMDVTISARVLLEQIIAATGIPPMLFGLSWSTTERMSKQQADLFLQTIEGIRREIEAAIRKAVDLHVRLSGRRDAVKWHCRWPDVSLQDQVATAQAANLDAQAALASLSFWLKLWQLGVITQEQFAAEVAGLEVIAEVMEPPPFSGGPSGGDGPSGNLPSDTDSANGFRLPPLSAEWHCRWPDGSLRDQLAEVRAKIAAEAGAEYPALAGRCNGKH